MSSKHNDDCFDCDHTELRLPPTPQEWDATRAELARISEENRALKDEMDLAWRMLDHTGHRARTVAEVVRNLRRALSEQPTTPNEECARCAWGSQAHHDIATHFYTPKETR